MAREYAQVRLSIWADDDFRSLSPAAQHLYFVLLTSPSLSYCGVVDWRPIRLAPYSGAWTQEAIEVAAEELEERLYLVIDRDTEEALVRSFIRNDGLLKQPQMAVAMAKDHAAIASKELRGVVVHELRRLHEDQPNLRGWNSSKATELLGKRSVDPSEYPTRQGSVEGSDQGSVHPETEGSGQGCPTPTPSPSPNSTSTSMVKSRSSSHQAPAANEPNLEEIARAENRDVRWAGAVSADILDRARTPPPDPTAYVLKAIRNEPDRYRPTPTAPPIRDLCDHGREGRTCPFCRDEARTA